MPSKVLRITAWLKNSTKLVDLTSQGQSTASRAGQSQEDSEGHQPYVKLILLSVEVRDA